MGFSEAKLVRWPTACHLQITVDSAEPSDMHIWTQLHCEFVTACMHTLWSQYQPVITKPHSISSLNNRRLNISLRSIEAVEMQEALKWGLEDPIPISNRRYSTCSSVEEQLLMASFKSLVVKPVFTCESFRVRRRSIRPVRRNEIVDRDDLREERKSTLECLGNLAINFLKGLLSSYKL